MSQTNVVSVGGIDYDEHSGMPLEKQLNIIAEKHRAHTNTSHAKNVHAAQQRSTALNRKFVKKAQPAQKASTKRSGSMDVRPAVKRSPHITKFARDPVGAVAPKSPVDVAAKQHPVVHRAVTRATAPVAHKPAPTARDIKHAAMGKALAHAASDSNEHKKSASSRGKVLNVMAASLGVLLIAGYFTYVNMPNLSVRVAAAQAGINASYPSYRPVGYRLNGPVAYQSGQVSMKFASNSGPLAFSLNQAKSSWDSSALLEKYVAPRSDGKYATYSDGGLTIYTYGNDAAWVNGGILYTVDGSATLSNEQIRRMATSL